MTAMPKPIVVRFKFEAFKKLPHGLNDRTNVTVNDWRLTIYPGGRDESLCEDSQSMLGLYLSYRGIGDVDAKISLILRDGSGNIHQYMKSKSGTIHTFSWQGASYGWSGFNGLTRSDIVNKSSSILHHGTLIVDAEIQFVEKKKEKKTDGMNILKLLESKEDSDISFRIGTECFSAHKVVLKHNAPVLFDLCENHDKDTPLLVKDSSKGVFRIMLLYVYGGHPHRLIAEKEKLLKQENVASQSDPSQSSNDMDKEIITVADRYGVVPLKMLIETILVESSVINLDNWVDWHLFADAKNCALLKEYSTNYFSALARDLMRNEAFKMIEKSQELMRELMLSLVNSPDDYKDKTSMMSVKALRDELSARKLEVDGSKETLVSRLNESNKRQKIDAGTVDLTVEEEHSNF